MILKPNGCEEIRVPEGYSIILIKKYEKTSDNKKAGDITQINGATNITFTDKYVTYQDKRGIKQYKDLTGLYLTVITHPIAEAPAEPVPEVSEVLDERQITIFDILGGNT